jgi:formamidopyrimidine-DNA glycosylase
MPELPEVEALRYQLENYCLECQITEVTIHEVGNGPRHGLIDDLVLKDSVGIENLLMGNKILEVKRKGKYLWVLLSHENLQDRPYFVVFHFGMTGSFVFKGRELPVYQSFQISSTWPPKFTKLLIKFKNGEEVAFCDPRRLGRIKVFQNEVALESDILAPLAKDCLSDVITGEYIFSQVQKSGCPIKTLLLDQQKVCCGIGNWVADEILYHSRIHPGTKSNQLSQIQCNHLSEAITMVITTACGVHANSALFPPDWIFHHRWEKRSSGQSSTERRLQGHIVRYETINGRTSAYIPELQRLESSRGEKVKRSLSSDSEHPSKRSKRTPEERIM